jgi:lysophospholipase L1-like esterase
MIGDSLFDLWKSTCANDLNGLENLTNIAIGGTNSMSWGKSLKLIQRELPVSNIIISLGTNDVADLHRTAQQTANGDSMGMGLKDLLNALHELALNAQIYLLTINICGEQNRWNARGEIRACN